MISLYFVIIDKDVKHATLFVSVLFLLPIVLSAEEEVRVENFSLHVEGRVISTSISITPLIPQPVVERIRGGLPAMFTYRFILKEYRKHWRDKKLGKTRVTITVKYDPVRVEYHISYRHKGELVDSKTFHHWQEAVNALTHLRRWELFTIPDEAVDSMLYVEAWVHLLNQTKWLVLPDDIKTDIETSSYFTIYE